MVPVGYTRTIYNDPHTHPLISFHSIELCFLLILQLNDGYS